MVIFKKLFSPHFYTDILSGTQKYRTFLVILLLALIFSIKPSYLVFKDVYPLVQNLEIKILSLVDEVYPSELTIKIQKGQASTNVTEPYYLTVRQETLTNLMSLKKDDSTTQSRIRLLAIDTKGKADDFESYQSLALLTQSSLVYYNDSKVNIYPLREVKDVTITKNFIISKIKEINKNQTIENLIKVGVLIAPIFIIIGIFVYQLFVYLFYTLLVYLIIRINQIPSGFKNSFNYTVAIAFIPTLIWNLLLLIPSLLIPLYRFDSLLTIIILGLAYSGIRSLKDTHSRSISIEHLTENTKEYNKEGDQHSI